MITAATLPTEQGQTQLVPLTTASGAAAPRRASSPYRIARVLLVPIGPQAEAVAQTVLSLSRCWLAAPPPLQILPVAELLARGVDSSEAQRAFYTAADGLADQALFAELRRAGYSLKDEDELAIWLILDADTTSDSSCAGHPPAPAAAIGLYHALSAAVWQRLHLQAVGHALLLVEPAQDALSPWTMALRQAEIQSIYTAGPINRRHLRLSAEEWCQRAATALVALLWGTFPSHGSASEPALLYAIGAAQWIAPQRAIKQSLAAQTAAAFIHQWIAQSVDNAPPLREQLPLAAPEQHVHDLSRTVPRPAALRLPGRPSWSTLRDLAAQVSAAADQHAIRQGLAQRHARQRWLERQVDAWQSWLGQLLSSQLAFGPGQLGVVQEQQMLRMWQQTLQHEAAQTDQQLEQIGAQMAAAERRVQRTRQQLEELCASLPAPTLSTVGPALLQPWRWGAWLWRFQILLPAAQQQLCEALDERAHLTWVEANWHTVRQFYLAMLQDLQLALGQRERLLVQLQACARVLTEQQCTHAEAAAPWSPLGLTRLWHGLAPVDLDGRLAAFCRDQPPERWTQLEPAALATALVQVAAQEFTLVDHWSALECLTLAVQLGSTDSVEPIDTGLDHKQAPGGNLDTTHQLLAWFDDHFDQAAPLWPSQPEAATQEGVDWLLVADQDLPHRLQSLMTKASNPLTAWAARKHTLAWAQSPAIGITFLRVQPLGIENQSSDILPHETSMER
jgi:uncharacterized protein YbdZ (MbtH family)